MVFTPRRIISAYGWRMERARIYHPSTQAQPRFRTAADFIMSASPKRQKRFAMGTTSGPNVANLQLHFWRRAMHAFCELKQKWNEYAVADDQADSIYTEDDFVVDAAEVIVLAGTSVIELAGQNGPPAQNSRTPKPTECLAKWFGTPLPSNVRELMEMYDALRHFGEAKHKAVALLDPEMVTRLLATAQEIWLTILKAEKLPYARADLAGVICWSKAWKANGTSTSGPPIVHFEHDFSFD